MLANKTIIVGVSGGIAAYKACEIVSRLKKLGADVWVVMTKEAAQLVTPLTFRTLAGNPVVTDLFSQEFSNIPVPHISLSQKASIFIIAPATANVIGKIANGIADDALTTIAMSTTAIKIIAPAMNCEMWRNEVVVKNVETLKTLNYKMIGPEEGRLACGVEDIGRMAEPKEIVEEMVKLLNGVEDLAGKHILVTAGGTREAIDPVRYISNRSSGKMGYALAKAARQRGAKVTLISGTTNLPNPLDISPIKAESADEMLDAVLKHSKDADAVIMAAAVADFKSEIRNPKSETNSKSKIKKTKQNLKLELAPTADILKTVAKQKGRNGKVLVGFALETDDMIKNAKGKLKEKDLDLIVANGKETFDSDAIEFSLIDRSGKIEDCAKQNKDKAAKLILDRVIGLM